MELVKAWMRHNEKYRCLRAPVLCGCGHQEKGVKGTPASARAVSEPLTKQQREASAEGYRCWLRMSHDEKVETRRRVAEGYNKDKQAACDPVEAEGGEE